MMLGLSNTENETNLDSVTKGAHEVLSGVPAEIELSQFADAVISRDEEAIAATRNALSKQIPPEDVIESASVIAHFDSINRVADAAGISLDSNMQRFGGDIIDTLGIAPFGELKGYRRNE